MQSVIVLLAALTAFASGTIHRCGLEIPEPGWTPGQPLGRFSRPMLPAGAARSLAQTRSLVTEHFILWYVLGTDSNAVQGNGRVVAAGDSVPGLVRSAATGLEHAWRYYVDTLGYLAPTSSGSGYFWQIASLPGKYPVEILNIGRTVYGGRESGVFGLTIGEGRPPSEMLLAADLPTFLPGGWTTGRNPRQIPPGWNYPRDLDGGTQSENYQTDWNVVMQATAAHELFHAVQYNYEANLSHFLFEASAVAMEKVVVPGESDYLYFSMAEMGGLCGVSNLVPMFSATRSNAYPHSWYVKQLVGDFGEGMLKALWQQRAAAPNQSIEGALREVVAARTGVTLDTTMARYALRLGLSGRRFDWLPRSFPSFSDASMFETLRGTLTVDGTPQAVALQPGQMQE